MVLTLQALLFRSELMLKSKESLLLRGVPAYQHRAALAVLPASTGAAGPADGSVLLLRFVTVSCPSNLTSLSWGTDGFCWQLEPWSSSSGCAILKHFWRKWFSLKRLSSYILKKK